MSFFPEKLQVCILGAGPAGVCAALRLVEMGHTVGIIEPETFPRPQIGESLSPTVQNIFAYMNAEELLYNEQFHHHLPSNIIWDDEGVVQPRVKNRPSNIVVNRGILDKQLLQLAVRRGVHLLQPARAMNFLRTAKGWQLKVLSEGEIIAFEAMVVLDARGRRGSPAKERITISPPMVAMWAHVDARLMPDETFVEAIKEGWLWGSKIPGNQYRIMAFTDGKTVPEYGVDLLFELAKKTRFFNAVSGHLKNAFVETCSVTSYVHESPWNEKFIKLGEAAFALDPLSSNGVEKAMRFSLQAAIAVNTFLKNRDTPLAKAFYEEKLIESISNHSHWTASFYESAWPYKEQIPFWKRKAEVYLSIPSNHSEFLRNLQHGLTAAPPDSFDPKPPVPIPYDLVLSQIQKSVIGLSHQLSFKEVFAVNNDCVEIISAVCHPELGRPVGYLEQLDLRSLLTTIEGITIEKAIDLVNLQLPYEKARKVIFHLWQSKVIVL